MQAFKEEDLQQFQDDLDKHIIYSKIDSLKSLKIFMDHHVYCVWDFMSLLKSLQGDLAPTTVPWMPSGNANTQRLINEIVVEEETDSLPEGGYASHFEIYLKSMTEVGADVAPMNLFLDTVQKYGLSKALPLLPKASRIFTERTFSFIQEGKPHIAAVAFCIGRESIIPVMFSRLLEKCHILEKDAPVFHYYLKRHIEIDGDKHGPMALTLLNELCGDDPDKIREARQTAKAAVKARVAFMDAVLEEL